MLVLNTDIFQHCPQDCQVGPAADPLHMDIIYSGFCHQRKNFGGDNVILFD